MTPVKCFAPWLPPVTLDVMLDRPDNLIALARTQAATAGTGLLVLIFAAGAAWPQAVSPPPSLGVQEPTQQTAPQQGESVPSPSPRPSEENSGLFNEMGKLFEKSLSILPTLKCPGVTI